MTTAANSTYTRGTTSREEPQAARPPRILSSGFPDRYRSIEFDFGTEGADTAHVREITLQVQKNGADQAGYFDIRLLAADDQYGAIDATNNAISATTGLVITSNTANCDLACQTDEYGKLVLDLTQSSAVGSRYLRAIIAGEIYPSGEIEFATAF